MPSFESKLSDYQEKVSEKESTQLEYDQTIRPVIRQALEFRLLGHVGDYFKTAMEKFPPKVLAKCAKALDAIANDPYLHRATIVFPSLYNRCEELGSFLRLHGIRPKYASEMKKCSACTYNRVVCSVLNAELKKPGQPMEINREELCNRFAADKSKAVLSTELDFNTVDAETDWMNSVMAGVEMPIVTDPVIKTKYDEIEMLNLGYALNGAPGKALENIDVGNIEMGTVELGDI